MPCRALIAASLFAGTFHLRNAFKKLTQPSQLGILHPDAAGDLAGGRTFRVTSRKHREDVMSMPQSPADRGPFVYLSRPWLRSLGVIILVAAIAFLGMSHVHADKPGAKPPRPNIVLIVGDDK